MQDLLNHREMLNKELKDVLPYQELLLDAVGQEQSEKLATEISNTLQEENQYTSTLCQELQVRELRRILMDKQNQLELWRGTIGL